MPRVSYHRWTVTTPITLARLVGDDNVFVYTGDPSPSDLQEARTLLREKFSTSPASIRAYNAATDAKKIVCPNPCCAGKLSRVEKSKYEGKSKDTRAHFRAQKRDSHIDGCIFKNPARKYVNRGTWRDALDEKKPVVVNLDYAHGTEAAPSYQGTSRRYGTAYEHWVDARARRDYVTHAVHSTQEFVEFATKVDAYRGDGGLDNLWVQANGHIATYRDSWLAQYDTGLSEGAVSRRVLSTLYNRGKNFVTTASTTTIDTVVRLGPLLIEADFQSEYNEKTRNITSAPVAIDDTESAYAVNAFHFAHKPRDLKGRFLLVARPSLYLGENHAQQLTTLQTLRDMIMGKNIDLRQPKTFRIEWAMAMDPAAQITRVPMIPLPLSERIGPAARL